MNKIRRLWLVFRRWRHEIEIDHATALKEDAEALLIYHCEQALIIDEHLAELERRAALARAVS